MTRKFIPYLLALLSVSCGGTKKSDATATYSNPVIAADAPDPSVIRAEDGSYYLYATGHGYPIYRSGNLVAWERVGTAFTDRSWPAAIRNGRRGDLWAPEIRRIGERYVLFYTLWFGDVRYSVIGYAVADGPEGPFVDRGILVDSQQIGVEQSIDPYYYEENGRTSARGPRPNASSPERPSKGRISTSATDGTTSSPRRAISQAARKARTGR